MPVPVYGMVATLALLGRRLAAEAAACRACCCCCCWAAVADEATRAVEEDDGGAPALLPVAEGCNADADDMGGMPPPPPPPAAARLSRRSQGLEGDPAVNELWSVAQQNTAGRQTEQASTSEWKVRMYVGLENVRMRAFEIPQRPYGWVRERCSSHARTTRH